MATEALAASAAALSEPVKASVLDTLTEPSTTLVMVQLDTTPCVLRMLASSVVQNCKHQFNSVNRKEGFTRHTVKQKVCCSVELTRVCSVALKAATVA